MAASGLAECCAWLTAAALIGAALDGLVIYSLSTCELRSMRCPPECKLLRGAHCLKFDEQGLLFAHRKFLNS